MAALQVVLDTNVIISALRSRSGSAFELLSLVGRNPWFEIHLSVPLVLEYEEVAKRQAEEFGLTAEDIDDALDYLCSAARLHDIFFLWRPVLRDPGDELVLEVAVAGGCEAIVTYNKRHFAGVERFGLRLETPGEFLERIREAK